MATQPSVRRAATSRSCHFRCLGDSTPFNSTSRRPFSSGPYINPEAGIEHQVRPRWQTTPRGMSMPFRVRPKPKNSEWRCNDDPRRLGDFYSRFLGAGGDKMLSEEVAWLAVTHKSFDQGKRGFNDRLSYMGRRIVDLQTSLALVSIPRSPTAASGPDEYGRFPFEHPHLEGLSNLSEKTKLEILSKERLAQLGREYGLDRVIRWKPRKVDNLLGSGIEVVLSQAFYAIIGAVSLERGGQVANQIARQKILSPLGVVPEE